MAPSVRLVVADLALLDAAIEGPRQLSKALGGAVVPDGWSGFPEALPFARAAIAADPDSPRWGTRFFVLDGDPPRLAGWGGFKGAPVNGTVELGYEIAPELRGRGLATAAVGEMLREAFASPEVSAVIAHTAAHPGRSTRVLEKSGFVRVGRVPEVRLGTAWRWRRERPES